MRVLGLGFLLLLIGLARASAVSSSAAITTPRPQGWINDQARILQPDTLAELNLLLETVHRQAGGEMAIVTVDTIAGANPRQFATELFNRWGIGDPTRNNGLLLFIARRDHKAEIILGRGIDSAAHVARSDRIMREVIVPRFRSGDSAGGLAAGARACAQQFYGVAAVPPPPPPEPLVEAPVTPQPAPVAIEPPLASRSSSKSAFTLWQLAVLVGGAGIGIGTVWFLIRHTARYNCPQCRRPMTKLDELQDDARLSAAERAEEKVGSVNYDVWLCPTCTRVEKARHGRWLTKYACCPRCGARTRSSVSRTLTAATTVNTGLVEVHEFCAYCNDTRVITQVLPLIIVDSSSSHGSSSGFSGGSSSGGGSSGSW